MRLLPLAARFIPDTASERDPVDLLRAQFVVLASLTVVVVAWGFAALFTVLGTASAAATLPVVALGTACLVFPYLLRAGGSLVVVSHLFIATAQLGLILSITADGGLADPGVMWLAVTPLIAAFAGGARLAWRAAMSAWALTIGLFALTRLGYPFPEGAFSARPGADVVVVINAAGCTGFVALLASLYEGPMLRHFQLLSRRLGRANADLRHELSEREAAQAAAETSRARAEAASAAKDALLANMSHEFRTPLTAILGFADVLETEVDAEHRPYLTSITRGAHRLLSTLNGVLEVAWLSSGDARLALSPTDLSGPVAEAVADLAPLAAQRGLSLSVSDAPACTVSANAAALRRTVEVLVDNAIRYTETGGVSVRVWQAQAAGVIEIVDTGAGMNAAFLQVAREPFRQASEGEARAYEGAGVGLAVASQLVERMGGTLTLDSAPEHGTTARVRLPLADAEPAQAGDAWIVRHRGDGALLPAPEVRVASSETQPVRDGAGGR